METLKVTFRKNGLDYKLLDRTDKTALFELKLFTGEMVGYEVCRINFNEAGFRFNKQFPESESIPSNETFGYDGSRAFFSHEIELAKEYFREFAISCKNATVIVASTI